MNFISTIGDMLFDFYNDDINGDPTQTQIWRIVQLVYNYGRTNKNYSCEYTSGYTGYILLGFPFLLPDISLHQYLYRVLSINTSKNGPLYGPIIT